MIYIYLLFILLCPLFWDIRKDQPESMDVVHWNKLQMTVFCNPLVPFHDSISIFIKNWHPHTVTLGWRSQVQQSSNRCSGSQKPNWVQPQMPKYLGFNRNYRRTRYGGLNTCRHISKQMIRTWVKLGSRSVLNIGNRVYVPCIYYISWAKQGCPSISGY